MLQGVDLCEALGTGVVTLLVEGNPHQVTAVHLWGDHHPPVAGSLIAAVGAGDEEAQTRVVDVAASTGAAAVVLPQPIPAGVRAHSADRGVTLAALNPQVEWSHFIWFARGLLLEGQGAVAGAPSAQQGLFGLAEVVATILGSPVTIEDPHSRVVAYSATTKPADVTRTSTIMGRAVPSEVLKRLRASGVLKRLARETRPFLVRVDEPGFAQRLVIPLRIGGQLIGSIWAISDRDLDPQLEARLATASTAVALHLVRFCAELELAGRYSVARLRAALAGELADDARDVPLISEPVRVVALQRLSTAGTREDLSLWRTFLRKKSWEDPVLVDVDAQVYAVVGEQAGPGGWPWLRELSESGSPGAVGASRTVTGNVGLAPAREEATEVLDAALELGLRSASHEQVWDAIVLRRAAAAVATVAQSELQQLCDADRTEGTELTNTLRAWLENWGDVNAAAATLNVHPNTVRLRVKKVERTLGGNLETPAQRIAALLLLYGRKY
ncbi:helix-turn-helix domain-containing protein [Mycolicibacterium goodii]|uniref:PucR family transcriptional regulator n=1 Tax=Mycolicibacterium goodii TaxID=134601 RepID=UPI001BDCD27F|nr:helix-turn-helix domain-containing protein [Mycolicibacterium goodii]MBU8817589.1 helix-turn-helix domain-containing protein [Mycolicibacterium goodii]